MGEVALINEFLGYVGEADADVFGMIKWRAQVEVDDVKGAEFGAAARQDAVDHHFD